MGEAGHLEGPLDYDASIIIIGAGTWGCSTALHLARRGYKSVHVFDPYQLPSPISAGNDVNKIIDEGPAKLPPNPTISEITHYLAAQPWLVDPVFTPYYHPTGFIASAHTSAGIEKFYNDELPTLTNYEMLESPEAFRETMPAGVLTGDFPNWCGAIKRKNAGWVFARGALMSAQSEAQRLGVRFWLGQEGTVENLIIEKGDVVGVQTPFGRHLASTVILAAGANAGKFLDLKDQLRPTAWTLAHIQMTEEERELYKDLPVLFNLEMGFFMEPDAELGELKICDEHPGYCNFQTTPEGEKIPALPFARDQVPIESEARVRLFLQHTMPHLASRPLSFARICWCADTPDRDFLIDRHPEYKNLILAIGASGHGFMHITSVGSFVADVMEGTLSARLKYAFRWRPETAVGRDWWDVQGRMGPGKFNRVMDFGDAEGWTDIPERKV